MPICINEPFGTGTIKPTQFPELGSFSSIPGSYRDGERETEQTNNALIHNIDKYKMHAPRQKLICVSTHIVNLSYNGAGRSDEYVCALKNQMLPAASDGLLRHITFLLS